ncbi:hypothetical protein GQ457_15G001840 [Hibiscus cannabinus]
MQKPNKNDKMILFIFLKVNNRKSPQRDRERETSLSWEELSTTAPTAFFFFFFFFCGALFLSVYIFPDPGNLRELR